MPNFKDEFAAQCVLRMEESRERIVKCVGQLSEDEMWRRPNSQLSSVANLVLHLCGNITQYAISSLGNIPGARERDKEFAATGGFTKPELLDKLNATIDTAISTIHTCTEAELLRVRVVQGFTMTGIGIVVHVTEHLSYHTGQIAVHTKMLRDKDLGFYAGVDLNK